MRGHDHDPHPRRLRPHTRHYIQTTFLAKPEIKKAQIKHLPLQNRFGLCPATGRRYLIALILETVTKGPQDRRFVVDQQNTSVALIRFH